MAAGANRKFTFPPKGESINNKFLATKHVFAPDGPMRKMAPPRGIEPPTYRLEGGRSIR